MDGSIALAKTMQGVPMPPRSSVRQVTSPALQGLDWFNFLVANVQTGFGPFIAVYLTTKHWTQVDIGVALSIGTVVSAASQLPAGALVDHLKSKRVAAVAAIVAITASALLIALLPTRPSVFAAEVLHGFASCVLNPAIAAMSLAIVGRVGLGMRLGRNARWASIGNGFAAAAMGGIGFYLTSGSVFGLTVVMCLLALLPLRAIGPARQRVPRARPTSDRTPLGEILALFTDRRLLAFAVAAFLFQLCDAAMLPLAAGDVTRQAGGVANLIIAASIVVPQGVVAWLSPWVGRTADQGRWRLVMVLGWAAEPLRGVLMALLPSTWAVVGVQSISGLSGAVFGVMMPMVCAEITRGTNRFNLAMGAVGLAMFAGASISTTLAGWLADTFGLAWAFIGLSAAGAAGAVLVAITAQWLAGRRRR
ncbi:MAG TPA: MFS transporter [Acidisphaera sp.]|nr:MFS transporter [Acidisphaera sp.]